VFAGDMIKEADKESDRQNNKNPAAQ